MTRTFLAIVGIAYLVLAVWCALKPGQTSNSVGLTLQPGSGQSEYLVVYGGLQLGLGLFFLWPLLQHETERGMEARRRREGRELDRIDRKS